MSKVKIGVFGAYRGASMIKYCTSADNAEVVAICDKSDLAIETQKKSTEGHNITFYKEFDEFIKHDMDAVVLANYANDHAPFAIKAMKAGKHVFSEVLPVQTMKQAVELVEAVEETGMIYAYGENYCYFPGTYEMRRLYKSGIIGEFEYGECEYVHNCEHIWPIITYGERDHWRNNMYSTFYCTHSIGQIIHAVGLRPVSVTGFEGTKNERKLRCGAKGGSFGMEIITLENGGIIKSLHGDLYKSSGWVSMYGSKGRIEGGREPAKARGHKGIFLDYDEFSGDYANPKSEIVRVDPKSAEISKKYGHGGSDFFSMWHFVEKVKGNPEADIIDVYEALDMFLPGMFAYRSILDGGIPKEIPNLRDKSIRDAWRNDTACTDPKVAGDQLLPTCVSGTPDIEEAVYDRIKAIWNEECDKESDKKKESVDGKGIL